MPLTMEDVAREAGVSKSTVSLALNDKPGISAELKQTVLQTAAALGYHLSQRRSLPRASANPAIAVVHSEPDRKPPGRTEPTGLYLHYLNGIRAGAQATNLNLTLIADYHEGDRRRLAFHLLQQQEQAFDGFILMGWSARQETQLVQQIIQEQRPAVALSRYWPDLPISTVGPNYRHQVHLALAHLVQLGHRHIAFLARDDGPRFDWYHLRLAAYQSTMQQLSGPVDDDLVVLAPTGEAAVDVLFRRREDVTAVFAVNDDFAVEVMRGLEALGRKVPQEISVIGQDDMAHFLQPDLALTTVGFSHFDVGHLAVRLLHQRIESEGLSHGNLWVRSYLVERATCAAPASFVK